MECPNCKKESYRLTYSKEGVFCNECFKSDATIGMTVVRGDNKYRPKMSYNESMHIKTRRLGDDGIARSHPRWETNSW